MIIYFGVLWHGKRDKGDYISYMYLIKLNTAGSDVQAAVWRI